MKKWGFISSQPLFYLLHQIPCHAEDLEMTAEITPNEADMNPIARFETPSSNRYNDIKPIPMQNSIQNRPWMIIYLVFTVSFILLNLYISVFLIYSRHLYYYNYEKLSNQLFIRFTVFEITAARIRASYAFWTFFLFFYDIKNCHSYHYN